MPFKIETITAYIAVDENGDEGVIGMYTPAGWMPFIGADEDRMNSLFPRAVEICAAGGRQFKVLRFSQMTDITEELKQQFD
jgi:hypothetical protein